MRYVVITGANGFLGSHLARRLVEDGIRVLAIDREACNTNLPKSQLISFQPCEMQSLDQFVPPEGKPDIFYHFAWQGVAPEHREDFGMQYENVTYCLNAVRLAARMGAKKFVSPGSTMEYLGAAEPIDAATRPAADNAYGCAKIAGRFLCQALCQDLGIRFIYAVIASMYGIGREDNNVIFYVMRSLVAQQRPSLTKMEQRWDYIHILDAADALYKIGCLEFPSSFYSIGNGDNLPLKEYVFMIRDLIDPLLPLGIGEIPYKNGSLSHSMINPSALFQDTGFRPTIPFAQGIREVIDDYRRRNCDSGQDVGI
ncbi:MAG: NAD(P)-dependent oxidoreductase [Firmicutes bacterium]|nr:NAD(P)-dependent oxidoreductase [Bacillota bacterium]